MSCIAPRCPTQREVGSLFCRTHLASPAGKRGGWISAERRRRLAGGGITAAAMTLPDTPPLNASNIARRLWVGAQPPFDRDLPFDVLVLAAEEIQPERLAFSRTVLRCPLDDGDLDARQLQRALACGQEVAGHLVSGKKVLVTCHMGINRSALVAALGLGLVTTMSADTLVKLLRSRRHTTPQVLSNPHFVKLLHHYIGKGRVPNRA